MPRENEPGCKPHHVFLKGKKKNVGCYVLLLLSVCVWLCSPSLMVSNIGLILAIIATISMGHGLWEPQGKNSHLFFFCFFYIHLEIGETKGPRIVCT